MSAAEQHRLRVAVVPPVPALLPEYAGLTDPVAELRAACLETVAWLLDGTTPDGPAHHALPHPPPPTHVESGVVAVESGVVAVESGVSHGASGRMSATSPHPTEIRAGSTQDRRVGEYLLAAVRGAARPTGDADGSAAGGTGTGAPARCVLLLANGSARRGEKAPGHFDPRASGFDEATGRALAAGDAAGLADLDLDLAEELLAAGAHELARLGAELADGPAPQARLCWAGDPYGVQYWVATWEVPGVA